MVPAASRKRPAHTKRGASIGYNDLRERLVSECIITVVTLSRGPPLLVLRVCVALLAGECRLWAGYVVYPMSPRPLRCSFIHSYRVTPNQPLHSTLLDNGQLGSHWLKVRCKKPPVADDDPAPAHQSSVRRFHLERYLFCDIGCSSYLRDVLLRYYFVAFWFFFLPATLWRTTQRVPNT